MIDEATRNYVKTIVENTPPRVGNIDSVLARGRRRRLANRIGTAVSVAVVAVLAIGVTAWLRPVDRPVATGTDVTMLELPGGFAVYVESDSVESKGAIVYVGVPGPEPLFDTTTLGTEVPLTRHPASEFIAPDVFDAATMVYLGDINGAQIALQVTDGGLLPPSTSDGILCVYIGDHKPIPSGGDCYIIDGPRAGTMVDPPLGGWLVWPRLPEATAAVQLELDDGTRYWQQPVARTVFFNLTDGSPLTDASLAAIDRDGNVIETATAEPTTPPPATPPPETPTTTSRSTDQAP